VIRGTPMLVQLFLIYYGLAQFEVRESFLWPWLSSATFCACLAFAINTSAYTAEIIAGSLKATPNGEIEAAKAMGMSRFKMYRRILLPSALRRALPQYSNEVIMMLQTTSLASIVTLIDITGAARTVNAQYYLPFEAYITAGVFYLCLTFILVRLFKMAERRWLATWPRGSTDMERIDHLLPWSHLGSERQLSVFRFGSGERKAYIQASLHADELPGMRTAWELKKRLAELEARPAQRRDRAGAGGQPDGPRPTAARQPPGRFEAGSGKNFNRDFVELSEPVRATAGQLGDDPHANVR
jgi:arginine/ornithine transport system permease protein